MGPTVTISPENCLPQVVSEDVLMGTKILGGWEEGDISLIVPNTALLPLVWFYIIRGAVLLPLSDVLLIVEGKVTKQCS